jgi:hypothetical protein
LVSMKASKPGKSFGRKGQARTVTSTFPYRASPDRTLLRRSTELSILSQ